MSYEDIVGSNEVGLTLLFLKGPLEIKGPDFLKAVGGLVTAFWKRLYALQARGSRNGCNVDALPRSRYPNKIGR